MIVGNKNLPLLRVAAHAAIDDAAEACRLTFVTPGSAQAMVYTQKAIEAQRFLAAYPTSATAPAAPSAAWPWISAEVGITAASMWQVATVIAGLAAQFAMVGAAIEKLRMGAKDAVNAAVSPDQIAASQVITWPTPPSSEPST